MPPPTATRCAAEALAIDCPGRDAAQSAGQELKNRMPLILRSQKSYPPDPAKILVWGRGVDAGSKLPQNVRGRAVGGKRRAAGGRRWPRPRSSPKGEEGFLLRVRFPRADATWLHSWRASGPWAWTGAGIPSGCEWVGGHLTGGAVATATDHRLIALIPSGSGTRGCRPVGFGHEWKAALQLSWP